MKIEALKSIIEFDGGQMVVINAGEVGELSDEKAQARIDAGEATPTKPAKKAASEPKPATSDDDAPAA